MARRLVESEVSGTVTRVACSEGAHVARDDPIVVVELMKMEIPVTAPEDGTVVELRVAEGDVVAENQPVAVLETA